MEPFTPGALDAYAGAYSNDDLLARDKIDAQDGRLFIRHFRRAMRN